MGLIGRLWPSLKHPRMDVSGKIKKSNNQGDGLRRKDGKNMLYVKIPGKTAHIIKGQYPEDHTTCCGLMAIVHDKYLRKAYKGKVCEQCQRAMESEV